MSAIKRPVLRYHGGKFLLAKWIISHFPPHRIYTEAFGGAGSVLMQKPRSYAEVYNDKWDTVVNVFRLLRNPETAKDLEEAIRLTPYSRTEFMERGEILISEEHDPIEKARKTILRSFMGFGSASTNADHATGFRAISDRVGTSPAHGWVNYPDHIDSFVERLKGVVIENRDFSGVIDQHDGPDTLHYLDPPYPQSVRRMDRGNASYAHEIDGSVHRSMADLLKSVKGMVIISGYRCDLYDELFPDYLRVEKKAFADGAQPRIECLWINQAAASKLNKTLFDHGEDVFTTGPEY